MTFRFFRLVLSALILSGVGQTWLQAAAVPEATPAPEEKKPKVGFIRLWNMLPEEAGDLQMLQDKGPGDPTVLMAGAPMNVHADYMELKPARYALKIVRSSDPTTVLKTFDVILKANVFVTIFARELDGKPSIELVDDTYDPEKEVAGKLTIRNFLKGSTVTVKSAATPQVAPLSFGDERALTNLPLKAVVFQMQATMADGKVKSWATEVNFKTTPHASLFLVTDVYGRFRPRTSPDGQAEVDYSKR